MENVDYIRDVHERIRFKLQQILKELGDDSLDLDIYNDFQKEIKDHIYEEETVIFKSIIISDKFRNEIIGFETEHAAMWRLMNLINLEIEERQFRKIGKYFDELLRILSQHVKREEQYLYSSLNKYSYVKSIRPPEWVCEKTKPHHR